MIGMVLNANIKAKSMAENSVVVFKNDMEYLVTKHFAKTLLRTGVEMLEIGNKSQNLSELLSLGTVLYNLIKLFELSSPDEGEIEIIAVFISGDITAVFISISYYTM